MPIITTFATVAPCVAQDPREHQQLLDDLARRRRLRPRPIAPVAQNVHASGQPDCDERQTVRRSRWRIATASTGKPSRGDAAAA